jgi:hypothetical protein
MLVTMPTVKTNNKDGNDLVVTAKPFSGGDNIMAILDLSRYNVIDGKKQQQKSLPVRSIARSAVHWYRSKMDVHRCNEDNVQTVLRTVVAHATTEVLSCPLPTPASSPSSSTSSSSSLHPLSRRHQARMEAFLAGCTLAVPNHRNGAKTKKYPQIPEADLQVRLELYLRSLQRFVITNSNNGSNSTVTDECVIITESNKDIRARARITTNAFVATATYVGNVTAILTRLLVCLTMEVLAVEHVSEDELIEMILKRRVVSEYVHGTSFASLAFLSTPEVNADTLLTPLIVKYLQLLQKDWKRWVNECEMERLIISRSSLPASTRSLFKTIEFQSIGHLMEVCHEFKHELTCIKMPSQVLSTSTDNAASSTFQLKRHVITLNGLPLPPVTGNRSDLVEMLTSAIMNDNAVSGSGMAHSQSKQSTKGYLGKERQRRKAAQHRRPLQARGNANQAYNDDSSLTMPSDFELDHDDEYLSSDAEPRDYLVAKKIRKTVVDKKNEISRADAAVWAQTLASKLLQCASYTGKNGSAYHVVKDLFGGEHVRVIPTTTSMNHILELRKRGYNGTLAIDFKGSMTDASSRVTVTIHDCFDVYPNDLPPEAGYCEPLVQFHTNSKEKVELPTADRKFDKSNNMSLSIRPSLHNEF